MKQYLMMCDERSLPALEALFRKDAVQFLEIQGMPLQGATQYNILLTPVIPPVNPVNIITPEPIPLPADEPVVAYVSPVTDEQPV